MIVRAEEKTKTERNGRKKERGTYVPCGCTRNQSQVCLATTSACSLLLSSNSLLAPVVVSRRTALAFALPFSSFPATLLPRLLSHSSFDRTTPQLVLLLLPLRFCSNTTPESALQLLYPTALCVGGLSPPSVGGLVLPPPPWAPVILLSLSSPSVLRRLAMARLSTASFSFFSRSLSLACLPVLHASIPRTVAPPPRSCPTIPLSTPCCWWRDAEHCEVLLEHLLEHLYCSQPHFCPLVYLAPSLQSTQQRNLREPDVSHARDEYCIA